MYRFEKNEFLKKRRFLFLDLLILELSFLIPFFFGVWRYEAFLPLQIFAFFICLSSMFLLESYKSIYVRGYWQEFKSVFTGVSVTFAILVAFIFFIEDFGRDLNKIIALMYAATLILTYIGRIVVKFLSTKYFKEKKNLRSVLLITTPDKVEEQLNTIENNTFSDFKIVGIGFVCDGNPADFVNEYSGVPVAAINDKISDYIKENVVDEVMISVPFGNEITDSIARECSQMGVVIHKILNMPDIGYIRHEVEKIGGYSVLTCSANFASPRQMFVKRAMDIAGSIVGIIITGILYVFVAPAIYIKSPGPIFFSQERVGLNGRRFKVYKFRSMYMDAEERKAALMEQNKMDGLMFKIDDDPRIIKGIGHFIRKTSIDEFPQMWNVLKGDMSLVGTRPPTVDEFMQYDYHHKSRLATKPGITGMWQVSGRSNITDFEEVVALDNKYIENWNIGLDIKILLKTFLVVFQREGSV